MKRGIFTLVIATSIFSISCTKSDAELTPEPDPAVSASAAANFASDWETTATWQQSAANGATVFTFNRNTPQLSKAILQQGTVVVWTRGYDFLSLSKGDKPLGLPFTWIPADERYIHPYHWHYYNTENNISVAVEMHPEMTPNFIEAKQNIRMRYFVITPDFMAAHNLSKPALRSMSYDKLIALLNVAP